MGISGEFVNVNNLKLAWQYQTGIKASFQSTPLVHEGIMYVSLPFNHVIALNAKTGKEIWRYEHDRNPEWKMCCGPSNRGLAISGEQLFMGTVDARLISLNIKTGEKMIGYKIFPSFKFRVSFPPVAFDT